jgi:hypothetical protein
MRAAVRPTIFTSPRISHVTTSLRLATESDMIEYPLVLDFA